MKQTQVIATIKVDDQMSEVLGRTLDDQFFTRFFAEFETLDDAAVVVHGSTDALIDKLWEVADLYGFCTRPRYLHACAVRLRATVKTPDPARFR